MHDFSLLLLLLLFWTCLSITNFIFPQFVLLHFLSYKTPLFTHQRNNSKSNNNKKLLRSSFVWRVYGCVRSANNICFEDFFVWNFYVLLLIRGYCIEIYTWIYIYTCTYVHTYGWECSFIHHTHTHSHTYVRMYICHVYTIRKHWFYQCVVLCLSEL